MHDSFRRVIVPREHWQSAGSRFQQDLWRTFPLRRKQKHIGPAIFFPKLLCVQLAKQSHISELIASDARGQLWPERPGSGNPEISLRETERCRKQKLWLLKLAQGTDK